MKQMKNDIKVIKLIDAKSDEEIREQLFAWPAVYIYSDTIGYECYWRPDGSGYSKRVAGIGVYTGEDAYRRTQHISDTDQFIEFEEAQSFC